MDSDVLQKLKDWRKNIAEKEGKELFRVLSNSTIEAIVSLKPKTKEELLLIKGIKEKKFKKYGTSILALVNEIPERERHGREETEGNQRPYTIGEYLDFLNAQIGRYKARVQGEVSSVDARGGYVFFSLKDKDNEGVLACFMWRNNYEACGVSLEIGMEVIADGIPEIYVPSGRFNLKVSTVELVGEGELKKAYDRLKQKLEREGLFSPERKRSIPEFPQRIGLITSETGAVIHDFLNNLGKYGYHISFVNSRVEGQAAVRSLLLAIAYFKDKDIDVLVIIRGGGSLESLQAFNNEMLVRSIAELRMPVICGIGHDKDVPLASLVADEKVSTPTAVTVVLNRSWEHAIQNLSTVGTDVIYKYQRALDATAHRIGSFSDRLIRFFRSIVQSVRRTLSLFSQSLVKNFWGGLENVSEMVDDAERQLKILDPARQLRLGYSIVSIAGKVVKTVEQIRVGDTVNIKISDGDIKSTVDSAHQQHPHD